MRHIDFFQGGLGDLKKFCFWGEGNSSAHVKQNRQEWFSFWQMIFHSLKFLKEAYMFLAEKES